MRTFSGRRQDNQRSEEESENGKRLKKREKKTLKQNREMGFRERDSMSAWVGLCVQRRKAHVPRKTDV